MSQEDENWIERVCENQLSSDEGISFSDDDILQFRPFR